MSERKRPGSASPREGVPASATGRPEREHGSAQREGVPASATGRPEREHRSAQREGVPASGGPGAARGIDLRRVEEAGLNALSTSRQLFYDGWLLRLSPGRARRARSVNPHFGSTLPLDDKIAWCDRVYRTHALPLLFRMTPFAQPAALASALAAQGFAAHDETLVQVAPLDAPPASPDAEASIEGAEVGAWVDAVAALRGSPASQRDAHLERLAHLPLASRRLVARLDGALVAAGQVVVEGDLAGVFDVVTAPALRRRGIASALVAALLARAWERGARAAYLQVDAANAPAIATYRRFGFATAYAYHYWARDGEFV